MDFRKWFEDVRRLDQLECLHAHAWRGLHGLLQVMAVQHEVSPALHYLCDSRTD